MKATFSAPQRKEDRIRPFRKEKAFYKQLSLLSGQKELVTVRFYATKSTCYCCVWVNFPHSGYPGEYPTQHPCGGGKGSTYNQDRESEAFVNACKMAGYSFSERISGRGMESGDIGHTALLSIGESLGFQDAWIHKANA